MKLCTGFNLFMIGSTGSVGEGWLMKCVVSTQQVIYLMDCRMQWQLLPNISLHLTAQKYILETY